MAYIPAGSFLMGDADTLSFRAQPPHMVTLSAYCMDLTEVTVAAYRGCTAPGCTTPSSGLGSGSAYNWDVAGRDNHPINGVAWNQSRAYCQWRGGDLPTEAQWEYAARGSDVDNHIYPWGNAAPASQLCWSGVTLQSTTCPVQSYPSGNSPFGLFDMSGNVVEWTLDLLGNYTSAAAIDPTGPSIPISTVDRVVRGGSWIDRTDFVVRAAYRLSRTLNRGSDTLGFRCSRRAI
jgi:formylglycine-generating enzyme required for sulfatase activity